MFYGTDHQNLPEPIIKQYLLDKIHSTKRAAYMRIIKSAILSYFEKNEQELKISFDLKSVYNTEEHEQSMSLRELMDFLTVGKPSISEKALFLCKFHRGLDISTLADGFNHEAWEQIVKWFGSSDHNNWNLDMCPVPLILTRVKTSYKHTGFLERDAIESLQKHLDVRELKTGEKMQKGKPMFINKAKNPITAKWITDRFSVISERAGIQVWTEIVNGRRQFKMDSHELRDLLKSTLIDSGCRSDVADHVIGHRPKDSYEKQTKLYPETLRKEYAKASKRLNIFTKFTSVVNGIDNEDELKLQLKEQVEESNKLLKKQKEQVITRYQDEFFAKNQQKQMNKQDKKISDMQQIIDDLASDKKRNDMQQTVDNLKSEIRILKKDKSEKLEFCCINCELVHDKESCPVCGSKQRRIHEEIIKN